MNSADDLRIAGRRTVADWKKLRARLDGSSDREVWTEAFEDFFRARLESRYFRPIRTLEEMHVYDGEGFAIVALQCSLIEFLASTLAGTSYRFRRNGDPPLAPFEYSKSSKVFIDFLTTQKPFAAFFRDEVQARDFYESVRCGLLHEARTKNGWRIRAEGDAKMAIDPRAKTVNRHKMGAAFDAFIVWYGEQLRAERELQAAFLRKFDSLCAE